MVRWFYRIASYASMGVKCGVVSVRKHGVNGRIPAGHSLHGDLLTVPLAFQGRIPFRCLALVEHGALEVIWPEPHQGQGDWAQA